MKATRRAVVAASGAATLGLAGCTSDGSSSTPPPTGSGESSATEPAAADPDQVALDRAVAITTDLLVALEGAPPGLDPAGRLAAMHSAHLDALQDATGVSARAFAYPFGTHDLAARTAVAAAGYDVAFAVAREHGRFAVDRVFVQSTDSLAAFRLKLSGGYRLVSRAGGRAWKVRHLVRAQVARARPGGAPRRAV